jgi:hypothetical protein
VTKLGASPHQINSVDSLSQNKGHTTVSCFDIDFIQTASRHAATRSLCRCRLSNVRDCAGHRSGRAAIFFAEADYRAFLAAPAEMAGSISVGVHAYVLMTNQVRLLLKPASGRGPAWPMKGLGQRCGLCGTVFAAEPPAEMGSAKYDDSAATMIALLRYGCGLPFLPGTQAPAWALHP